MIMKKKINEKIADATIHMEAAEASYSAQDYPATVKEASEAFYICHTLNAETKASDIMHRAIKLISDVLVIIWSMTGFRNSSDKEELKEILTPAVYVFDILDTPAKEDVKVDFCAEKDELKAIIENLDPTWKDEMDLMYQLKNECDKDGKEINQIKSAKILHKMAIVHLKRRPDKLSIIYSNALLAAAFIRDPSNQEILNDMKHFDEMLLHAAGAQLQDADLFQISKEIFAEYVKGMRQKTEIALGNIYKIEQGDESKEELKQKEVEYFNKVKEMMKDVAENYASMMKAIAEKCISVLGPAPCKFSHGSMGSLPRNEITPFSEFENFILLDNDAKKMPNYEEILEYFRWYSVLFQVIIIYFGESPLRLMGIPSLNDFYFHNKSKDWFWDDITPCGIQFDSVMPFASKFPLRRRFTRNKPWNLELIKTVKEMTKCVSSETTEENGYNLSDMLTRTCCVYGSNRLYKKFQKRSYKILQSQKNEAGSVSERILKQLENNLYNFSYQKVIIHEKIEVDVKKALYRTATIFITAIGRLLDVEDNSCFDIIGKMQEKGLLNEDMSHNLMFAVAVACEVRMVTSNIQWHEDKNKVVDLFDKVGKRSIFTYCMVVYDLQEAVKKIISSKGNLEVIKEHQMKLEDMCTKAEICVHFSLYQEALACLTDHEPAQLSAPSNVFAYFLKGITYMELEYFDEAQENFNFCLAIILSLPEAEQPVSPTYIHLNLGVNMLKSLNLSEAREHLYCVKEDLQSKTQSQHELSYHDRNLYIATLHYIAMLHFSSGKYEMACEQCQVVKTEAEKLDFVSHFQQVLTLELSGKCLEKLGRYQESILELEEAVTIYEDNHSDRCISGKVLRSTTLLPILLRLSSCYMKLNETASAEKSCNVAIAAIHHLQQTEKHDLAHVKLMLSNCYIKQNKHGRAATEAFDAFSVAFNSDHPKLDRSSIMHDAIKVIYKSSSPVQNKHYLQQHGCIADDIQLTLEAATRVYGIINEGSAIAQNEFERDKSILVRVIQRCVFELGEYEMILLNCKQIFLTGQSSEDPSTFLDYLLSPILKNSTLLENVERNAEQLMEIAKSCNIRDSISFSGALVIFVGWLLLVHRRKGEVVVMDDIESNLSLESNERKNVILHTAVKVAIYTINYYVKSVKDESVLERIKIATERLISFATKMYMLVQSQENMSDSLMHESAGLINSIAACWMKMKDYETALSMYNEALTLQENLAKDNYSFKGVSTILDNIATCLGRLHRLEEAQEYMQRGLSMKENRRKSHAFEDHSILQVRVKTALCSFNLGNFKEAAQLACEAFHEGLGMDGGIKRDDAMSSAADIVIKCTLKVCMDSQLHDTKDIIRSVLEYSVTLQTTLKDRGKQLGRKFSDLIEPLRYALGNCYKVLEEYKPALKCFNKSLKKVKQSGELGKTEKSLILNISKCLLGLKRYQEAADKLEGLLSMEREIDIVIHVHPSYVHNLLAVCFIKQHKYYLACCHAYAAVLEALKTTLKTLHEQITEESSKIYLTTLCWKQDLEGLGLD